MSDSAPVLTRDNLLAEIDKSWKELLTFVGSLSKDQLVHPTDAAGWTVKDHLIHIAMWENSSRAMLEGKSKRETLDISQEVWDLDEDDPINAVLQERYHDMPLSEVLHTLRQNHEQMMLKLNSMTEADMQLPYSHYQPGSTREQPIIQFIKWDTVDHFRDHIPWMTTIAAQV